MSFSLPIRLPLFARLLRLQMDWQSRPWHGQRSYHDRDRRIEVSVGRTGLGFALEVSRYEEDTRLRVGIPWLQLFLKVGPGAMPPVGEMSVSWGVSTFERRISFDWGSWSKSLELNPFRWDGYERARLRADGDWDSTEPWKPEGEEIDWYVETHPYAIASEPTYFETTMNPKGPHFSIKTWEAEATCHIDRTVRTRRWLPFWRRTEFFVDFRLNDEIGHRKGSWKGGTVGFAERMLPGDRVADVVQRAARSGRGR